MLFQQRARAPAAPAILRAKRLHDGDQVVVANALQLADRVAVRLRVRLRHDLVDERAVELRHVHELGPRPFQRRAELVHEMAHARLAAGDAVGHEGAHLRPAQTEGIADDVVDLLGRGDVVVHEPKRFAPERLQQPIADEGVDLLAHDERLHADRGIEGRGPRDRRRRRPLPGDDLDQRQQVDGIEGMSDDEPLRTPHRRLQVCREQARGGRGNKGIGRRVPVDLGKELALQLDPLRRAFLHVVRLADRRLDRGDEAKRPAPARRRGDQLGEGAVGIRDDLADLAFRFRIRIVDGDVDSVLDEARRPAGADDAAADDRRLPDLSRHSSPVL